MFNISKCTGDDLMVLQKSRIKIHLTIHWCIGVLLLLAYLISLFNYSEPGDNVTLLSWTIILVFSWCLYSWKRVTGNLFNPYTLFFTAVMLFNAGQAFLEVIGANLHGYLEGRFIDDTIAKSLFLSLLCIYTMHFFALITLLFVKTREVVEENQSNYRALRTTGLVLLGISIIPSIAQWKNSIQTVLNSGYMGLYQGEAATGFSNIGTLLSAFLTPAIMFLLVGGTDRRWARNLSLLLLLISTSILFFLGYRATAIMPVAAYFWLYDQKIKKINRAKLFLSGAFFLLVIFPLVRAVRSITGEDKLSIDFLKNTYFSIDNPLFSIINEMGSSMFTVAHTIQLIPTIRNFDLGISYLYAPLTFFPNFFWDVHPSMNHTYSKWLVWTVDPRVAERGGGYGYSAIAEAYANFGWFAPLLMGLVAVLLVMLYTKSLKDSARIAFVASFLAFFFIYARGESIFVARTLLWYAFLPYCLFLFIQMAYRNKVMRKTASFRTTIN